MYYRKAKELGYRARSAFKLIQIDEQFDILRGVTRAVDLCSAPGGWTQVLRQCINSSVPSGSKEHIIAVDLQGMHPIEGVHFIQGDITRTATAKAILSHFNDVGCDIVVCDGAPDVWGLPDVDEYIQMQLLLAALNVTKMILIEGGTFVAKIFRGKNVHKMLAHLQLYFGTVSISKPKTCRNSSMEGFVVCQNYRRADTVRGPLPGRASETDDISLASLGFRDDFRTLASGPSFNSASGAEWGRSPVFSDNNQSTSWLAATLLP